MWISIVNICLCARLHVWTLKVAELIRRGYADTDVALIMGKSAPGSKDVDLNLGEMCHDVPKYIETLLFLFLLLIIIITWIHLELVKYKMS
jgi:hypothetical protein